MIIDKRFIFHVCEECQENSGKCQTGCGVDAVDWFNKIKEEYRSKGGNPETDFFVMAPCRLKENSDALGESDVKNPLRNVGSLWEVEEKVFIVFLATGMMKRCWNL